MYRDDYVANAIYKEAREWIRASFLVAHLGFNTGHHLVYFSDGTTMSVEATGTARDLRLLFCNPEPQQAWPHDAWVVSFCTIGKPEIKWTRVTCGLDRSALYMEDCTAQIQFHLNRLRRREEIMMRGLAGQPWRTVPLFSTHHSEIARVSGVSESTVRGFFDGRPISAEAQEKILLTFNIRPEELETKLWEP